MYSTNDYRNYLEHSWGKKPEQKAAEKAYNQKYYEENKSKWKQYRENAAEKIGLNARNEWKDAEWITNEVRLDRNNALKDQKENLGNADLAKSLVEDYHLDFYKGWDEAYRKRAKSAGERATAITRAIPEMNRYTKEMQERYYKTPSWQSGRCCKQR